MKRALILAISQFYGKQHLNEDSFYLSQKRLKIQQLLFCACVRGFVGAKFTRDKLLMLRIQRQLSLHLCRKQGIQLPQRAVQILTDDTQFNLSATVLSNNINSDLYQEAKMLGEKIKQILKKHSNLPFVIYNKIYLVPPRPQCPRFNYLITKSSNLLEVYKKYFPEKVNQQFIERAKNQTERAALISEYLMQAKLRHLEHSKLLKQYQQNIIQPLKRRKMIHPAIIYYTRQKDFFKQYWAQKQRKFSLADIYHVFNSLPIQTKKSYEEAAQRDLEQRKKKKAAAEQHYRIPDLKKVSPHILYLQETYQKIQRALYGKFQQLPEDKKQEYKAKALDFNKQKKDKFFTFLKERKLSVEDFNQIQVVCQQFEMIKGQLKAEKKLKVKLLKQKSSNQTKKDSQSIEQISALMKQYEQDHNLNVDLQQALDPEIISQDTQPAKIGVTNENSEGMDMDFDQPQLDINQLKKKTKQAKKEKND